MSSIVTAVFESTIGLVVNKGRDKVAEKLKDGDVTDQNIRGLIVREVDDIKSKLDGLSSKDLLASISFFSEGIEYLYEVFHETRSRNEYLAVTTQAQQAPCVEAFFRAEKVRNLVDSLDASATRALSNAKKRFEDSRRKATEAFSNKALKPSDRILAMKYRVMATILENVDNPVDSLVPCRVCIEELHSLPVVQSSFQVALSNEGFGAWFNTRERLEIIANVCHVNRVIYDVTWMSNRFGNKKDSKIMILAHCPSVSIPDRNSNITKVYPLFDSRVADALREVDFAHACVPWSFGQEGEEQHMIGKPHLGFATNSHGQFVLADYGDGNVKIFDCNGKYQCAFYPISENGTPNLKYVYDVATDLNDKIYVLAAKGLGHIGYGVHVFSNMAEPLYKFPLQKGDWNMILVNDHGKVMVLGTVSGNEVVDVYETGQHVCRFGEQILKDVCDATAVKDGNVMVVDSTDSLIHLFSEWGEHLKEFQVQGRYNHINIAFHQASELVVAAGVERETEGRLHFYIYTKDGELYGSRIEVYRKEMNSYMKTAMAIDQLGRIAIGFLDDKGKGKMLVV